MNNPLLYQNINTNQRRVASDIIKEFKNLIQWRVDGHDTLLDIGCGTGDVTNDYILPIMPKNFEKVIGADISENMVSHARDKYHNSKISFIQMDIAADPKELEKTIGQKVDHIISFFCLNWVQAQKKAVDNIYKLLLPDGDCLLVFLVKTKLFDIYKDIASMSKWKSYMEGIDKYITPHHYSENPVDEFRELFSSSGFSKLNIESRTEIFTYDGIHNLKNYLTFFDPFITKMPLEVRDEYFDEVFTRFPVCKQNTTNNELRLNIDIIVAYGRKQAN